MHEVNNANPKNELIYQIVRLVFPQAGEDFVTACAANFRVQRCVSELVAILSPDRRHPHTTRAGLAHNNIIAPPTQNHRIPQPQNPPLNSNGDVPRIEKQGVVVGTAAAAPRNNNHEHAAWINNDGYGPDYVPPERRRGRKRRRQPLAGSSDEDKPVRFRCRPPKRQQPTAQPEVIEISDSDTGPDNGANISFDKRIGVVEKYKLSRHHDGRNEEEKNNIAAKLRAEYFPYATTSHLKLVLGGSVMSAFVALYSMEWNKVQNKDTHQNPEVRPPKPSEDSISISAHLEFSTKPQDEMRAALWYCIHCVRLGNDMLSLVPKLHPRRKRQAKAADEGKDLQSVAMNVDPQPNNEPEEPVIGECLICISDLTSKTTVECTGKNKHKICKSCVEKWITDEVWDRQKHQFTCFAITDGSQCTAPYSLEQYKYIDKKTLDEIDDLDQEAEVKAAGLKLTACRYCNFKMVYEPPPDCNTFWCLADGCKRTSCLRCDGPGHVGQTCAQYTWLRIKQGNESLLTQLVEETMSQVVTRRCNGCGAPFIRSDGCNKMKCRNDKCKPGERKHLQCYACHKTISGYQHFKEWPESDGLQCPKFDGSINREEVERSAAAREVLKLFEQDLQGQKFKRRIKEHLSKIDQKEEKEQRGEHANPLPDLPQNHQDAKRAKANKEQAITFTQEVAKKRAQDFLARFI